MPDFNPYVLTTNTGKHVDLMNPDPSQFTITDIAFALSKLCRFNGQIKTFYSVAEHSMKVAEMLPKKYQLQGLLHDASEAYICDVPTPLKHLLGETYYAIERRIQGAIGTALGVELVDLPEAVKKADMAVTVTERDHLRAVNNTSWGDAYENSLRYPNFQLLDRTLEQMANTFIGRYEWYKRETKKEVPREENLQAVASRWSAGYTGLQTRWS